MPTGTKERRPPLDTTAAATYTGAKPNYLEKLRCTGGGPVFIKRNGMVRYDPDDLDAWLEAGKRRSTSETREVA
jgi:Helix-turn-helix domain